MIAVEVSRVAALTRALVTVCDGYTEAEIALAFGFLMSGDWRALIAIYNAAEAANG